MKFDNVDTAILDLLRANARTSNREVARALDISEGMVRQRLKKMESAKAMRIGLVADIATAGYHCSAILRLRTEPNRARDVATAIAKLECCAFSGLVLGRFDVLAFLIGQNRAEMAELIDSHIARLPGVVALDIREPVGSAKQRYDFMCVT